MYKENYFNEVLILIVVYNINNLGKNTNLYGY